MDIPERYTKEDSSSECRNIYDYYKSIMENLSKSEATCRNVIFDINGIIWEESDEDYAQRMKGDMVGNE